MNYWKIIAATSLSALCIFVVGCGESLPENTRPADGSNPRVAGAPEARIEKIQGDPTLTDEEKARRIAFVKEKNHLK